jgi:NAD(P)-dependent dehydrogenase (short-subunit alcohol dehydrogenase family)
VTPLNDRRVLVTGGTSGIGRGIVERLCEDGATVVFTGRSPTRGEAVAQDTGATFIAADASQPDAVAASAQAAIDTIGGLDLLVNNAGLLLQGSIEDTPAAAWRELVAVNLTAAFLYSRACLRALQASRGAIVHIGSDTSIRGIGTIAAYSVTKAGVLMLSDMLAAEGAPHGVRSNVVCPGDILPGVQATPRGFEHHAEDPAGWVPPPGGRFGEARDVANLVAFLARDEAAHISGATLRIDAGNGAGMPIPGR